MATVHPCRKDRHNYRDIGGVTAGIGRAAVSTAARFRSIYGPHSEMLGTACPYFGAASNPLHLDI